MDTYLTLFGKRDLFNEKENIDKQAVYGENANGTFLVPKPSKYVPDWVAFGAEEPENRGDNEGGEDNDQRNLIQVHKLKAGTGHGVVSLVTFGGGKKPAIL